MSRVILIVDDDRSVRTSLARLLGARGYTTFQASSVPQALQKAHEVHPDVILMDLQMPPGSGIDAARELKRRPELKDTPLIGISATPPEAHEQVELFETILIKPCPSAQMLAAIESAVRR